MPHDPANMELVAQIKAAITAGFESQVENRERDFRDLKNRMSSVENSVSSVERTVALLAQSMASMQAVWMEEKQERKTMAGEVRQQELVFTRRTAEQDARDAQQDRSGKNLHGWIAITVSVGTLVMTFIRDYFMPPKH